MFRKIILEPLVSNGEDLEVLHWASVQQQLKDIGQQVKEIAGDVGSLRRQFDQRQSDHEKLVYRVDQLEKKPEESRARYTLYTLFGGCAYMVVNLAVTVMIAAATIYLAHH